MENRKEKIKIAYENLEEELDRFIDNTIDYAKKEKERKEELLKALELADKLVRCKDCKEFHRSDDKLAQHCKFYGAMVQEDDFCSYGKRNEK